VVQSGRARRSLAPALMGVGGALMAFGSTLTWIRYAFAQPVLDILSQSRLGVAGGAGRITLACGAAIVAMVPFMMLGEARWRRGLAIAVVALGLAGAVLAGANLATKDAQVYHGIREDIGRTTGHPLTDPEFARLKAHLLATGFLVSLGPGIYLVVAGGLLALAGGLAELADGQQSVSSPRPPSGESEPVPPEQPLPPI
jgi:hypothetical protein